MGGSFTSEATIHSARPFDKIVIVTRKTRLEGLIDRFNTLDQAKFYVEHAGADFSDYQLEHASYENAVQRVTNDLQGIAKLHRVERRYLSNYIFAEGDLVVVVGQDGTVVNTAKYLDGQPIVGVNPDPNRFDGVLLPFRPEEAGLIVRRSLRGEWRSKTVRMADAKLEDGQALLAFNDFFIGSKTHTSALYKISFGGREEVQSSSGIIVSTGAGSTGWLSSVYNMVRGISPLVGVVTAAPPEVESRFDWNSPWLRFVVREPFRSNWSQVGLLFGDITEDTPLRIESRMPEGGVIFSDGVEGDFLSFDSGATATIGLSSRSTELVTD